MSRIFVGISSWADRTLVASNFYPSDIKTPAERLRYYSENFPVAELDSSYHHMPTRRNLDMWLNNATHGFRFHVKAFSIFTQHPTQFTALPRGIRDEFGVQIKTRKNVYLHHLPEEAVESLWQGFTRTVEMFQAADKLGVILFQFPPWFHPVSKNFEYLTQIRERLHEFKLAVEFRYNKWLDEENREETTGFLKST